MRKVAGQVSVNVTLLSSVCRCNDPTLTRFLIAYLQMEALKACPDVGSLRETVNTLPSGLGEMYNLTLARIDSQPKSIAAMARVALLWVSRARRRLKVKELLEAVATSYTPGTFITGEFRENKMPTWEILSSATGGLMVTDDHGEARLIREYPCNWSSGVRVLLPTLWNRLHRQ